jgi:hypothetical protein
VIERLIHAKIGGQEAVGDRAVPNRVSPVDPRFDIVREIEIAVEFGFLADVDPAIETCRPFRCFRRHARHIGRSGRWHGD